MSWPILCLAAGIAPGACLFIAAWRYPGELSGAVLRLIAGVACCTLGIVAGIATAMLG